MQLNMLSKESILCAVDDQQHQQSLLHTPDVETYTDRERRQKGTERRLLVSTRF
jgi:hypothetical protein